ncbi:hypothetical protein QFZ94_008933 [Paraburkholderia sp. JPY465]|uniref:hypothetical protein n=1 Tax=Paraburkholderia sp. JPY465 TaxID=3042285 RepID=UPI003D204540
MENEKVVELLTEIRDLIGKNHEFAIKVQSECRRDAKFRRLLVIAIVIMRVGRCRGPSGHRFGRGSKARFFALHGRAEPSCIKMQNW